MPLRENRAMTATNRTPSLANPSIPRWIAVFLLIALPGCEVSLIELHGGADSCGEDEGWDLFDSFDDDDDDCSPAPWPGLVGPYGPKWIRMSGEK